METINRTRRKPTEWEKIFTVRVTNKGLISKIHRQLTFTINKTDSSAEWADLNRHFSKQDIQMADRQEKRCSTSLIIREVPIRPVMSSDHLTLVRRAVIKRPTNSKCWRGYWGRDPPTSLMGMYIGTATVENGVEFP